MQLAFEFYGDRKRVLVVGSGGREHALVWKLSQSQRVKKLYCAPGNGGISMISDCIPIEPTDVDKLIDFVKKEEIDFTLVGPEAPLAVGIVDRFRAENLRIFGPTQAAARLETSKVFAKQFMRRHGIPTADFRVFSDYDQAMAFAQSDEFEYPLVVKADGLAAGKGVTVCKDLGEVEAALGAAMKEKIFGPAGERVVIEEFLQGEEASFMIFTDGEQVLPMVASRDHKAAFDGDQGPNTGGMGAYSTDDILTKSTTRFIMERIIWPTIEGMASERTPYQGVLYVGLMITPYGPRVLEYNARFGDPEAQVVLTRMQSDLYPILEAVSEGSLWQAKITWSDRASVCIVLASRGYPGSYEKGKPISGLELAEEIDDVIIFHAGTRREGDRYYTAGGRVLGITALGYDLAEAIIKGYEAVNKIYFEGMHYRRDIGAKGLSRKGV